MLVQWVMVMNKGVVEQIGMLVEVYEKLVSCFVVSFIGSLVMNLLDGVISVFGDCFELSGGLVLLIGVDYWGYVGCNMMLGI